MYACKFARICIIICDISIDDSWMRFGVIESHCQKAEGFLHGLIFYVWCEVEIFESRVLVYDKEFMGL